MFTGLTAVVQIRSPSPCLQELLRAEYSTEVEMSCDTCPGRLASVFGENVGVSAGTAEVTGGHRALVWTSSPREDCSCLASATGEQFAPSPTHSDKVLKALKVVAKTSPLEQRVRSVAGRAAFIAMTDAWSHRESDPAAAASATRMLNFAEEAMKGFKASEESVRKFSDAFDELTGNQSSFVSAPAEAEER